MANDIRKGGIEAPFETYDQLTTQRLDKPFEAFSASAINDRKAQLRANAHENQIPAPVALPRNIWTPEDAQSLDVRRRIVGIAPGATATVFEFLAPKGATSFFVDYVLQTTAVGAYVFVPSVNEQRAIPYHGNPPALPVGDSAGGEVSYSIDFVSTADPFLQIPIDTSIQLQPNDVMRWRFTNLGVVAVDAFVRMRGYVDKSLRRKQGRFGG